METEFRCGADDVKLTHNVELAGQHLSGFGTMIDVMWLLTLYGAKAGLGEADEKAARKHGRTHNM